MINLDYYFRTDIYELENLLVKGLAFDYFKTSKEYGFALYLTTKPEINLTNQNIITTVHLKNLNNILIVTNFQEFLTNYLIPNTPGDVSSYVNANGKTERFGTKFVEPFMSNNSPFPYNGLKITSENLLVLYNTKNIKTIKLFS